MVIIPILALYGLLAPVIVYFLAYRKGRFGLGWALICFFSPYLVGLPLVFVFKHRVQPWAWHGIFPALAPLLIITYLARARNLLGGSVRPEPSPAMKVVHWGVYAFCAFAIFVTVNIVSCLTPTTRLGAYERTITASRGSFSELTSHFPRASSKYAELTRFHANPGGFIGAHWVAHFRGADGEFVESLRKTYARAGLSGNFGQAEYLWKHFSPRVGFKADSTERLDEYELILLVNTPGNHAKIAGLFVSKKGTDAIFFGER